MLFNQMESMILFVSLSAYTAVSVSIETLNNLFLYGKQHSN